LATLLLGGAMLISTMVAPPPPGAAPPPFPLAVVGGVMAVICTALSAWGIWTAIAIFRRRGWARYSILIFAGLLTFIGVMSAITICFMPFPPQAALSDHMISVIRSGVAAFYGVLAAIGVWWLVQFNLSSSREYFAQTAPTGPPTRPVSLSVIGWYLLIVGLAMLVPAAFRMPAFVLGMVVTGWAGAAAYASFAVIQIALGRGLLRLKEWARVWSIGYFCFACLNAVLAVAPPGLPAKMQILQREMPRFFPAGIPAQFPQPAWLTVAMGIVVSAVPVWFLLREQAAFTDSAGVQ
jgi:hypothetical protein